MPSHLLSLTLAALVIVMPVAVQADSATPGYKKFQEFKVGDQGKEVLAKVGPVEASFDGFTYRVGNAFNNLEQTVISRVRLAGEPAEIIVAKQSGKVVRRQLSSPKSFPPLKVPAASTTLLPGMTVDEASKKLGAPPYLWIEFAMAANALKPAETPPVYQTLIWPDGSGQLAALVLDGKIVKAEYQGGGEALLSSAPQPLDPAHPRIPRWLMPAPNNNGIFAELEGYRAYLAITMGTSEADVAGALGKASSISETKDKNDAAKITQRVHKYEFKDAARNISSAYMFFFVPPAGKDALGANDGVLNKKNIFASTVANTMRPRHIPQGLTGMTMAQLEAAFGGPGRVHEQRLAPDGKEVTVYGWGGQGAFFAMDFPAGATAGTKTSSGSSGDKDELASRYEEYVLILP